MGEARDLYDRWWEAFEARDWDRLIETTSEDHVWELPGNSGGLPWFGIPANDRSVDMQWISEYRVQDGKVVAHWAQMDLPTMMTQLGTMGGT